MRCELQETSGLIDVVGSLAWSETVDWASQGYSQWLSFTGMERVGERVGECTGDVRRDHESLFEGGSLLVVVGGDTEPPGSDDVVGIDSGKKDVMGVDAALASESDRSIGERLRRPRSDCLVCEAPLLGDVPTVRSSDEGCFSTCTSVIIDESTSRGDVWMEALEVDVDACTKVDLVEGDACTELVDVDGTACT